MKIESKFNALDTVWVMHKNMPHSFNIYDMEWSARSGFSYADHDCDEWFTEDEVFASKWELIDHLKKM